VAALTYPVIDPVFVQLGPVAIQWYGLAYLLGFALAAWIAWDLIQRWDLGLTSNDLLDMVLAAGLGVILGGRLGYVLFYNFSYFMDDPGRIIAVWDGGMSFHGGLAGILLAGLIMSKRLGISFLRICDLGAVGAPLGILFGRLANFIKPELWGRTTDVPWGFVFPGAGPLPRHPSQLYEAFGEGLVIFVVLFLLSRKKRSDGMLVGVLLAIYGVVRFLVEYVREPDPQLGLVLGPLTMGQILTLPVLATGIWLVWSGLSRRSSLEVSSTDRPGRGI